MLEMAKQFDPYHRWLGIPSWEQPPNHYRLLGLTMFESDADVIESAADQRMAHVRTFQCGEHASDSQKLLNELAAAKLCLLTPERKTPYDTELMQKNRSPLVPNEKKWHTVQPVNEPPSEIPLAPAARRRRFKFRPETDEPTSESSFRLYFVAGAVVVVLFLAVAFGRDIEKLWSGGQPRGTKSSPTPAENLSKTAEVATPDFFTGDEPSAMEPTQAVVQNEPSEPDDAEVFTPDIPDFFASEEPAPVEAPKPKESDDFFKDDEPPAKPTNDTSFFDDN